MLALLSAAKRPLVAVDGVVVRRNRSVVLVKRRKPPYEGYWALPGGLVEYGETVEEAVAREVREETGLEIEIRGLVGVYSKPNRDPRGHVISIAFLVVEVGGELRGSRETEVGEFYVIPRELAFDHREILREGLEVARRLGIDAKATF
jgi:8-oxo-dGTP diphosphatase